MVDGVAQLVICLPDGNGRQRVPDVNFEIMNVYVLLSEKDGRFYVGMSQNVERRLFEHNNGKTTSTKGYRPWVLIHEEAYPDRGTARKREKYLKSGYGKQWLKQKYKQSLK